MISKEEFLSQASLAYDQWMSQNPSKKDAYTYEKDFEGWFLEFGRKLLEGDKSNLPANRNQKKKILSRFGLLELGLDHPLCVRPQGFGISPYMQDLSCYMGQEEVYDRAEELLEKYLRVTINSKQLERLCNTYGEAIADRLSEERLDQGRESEVYVMPDGSMILTREEGWKEVKLGRIFEKTDLMAIHPHRNLIGQSEYVAGISGLGPFLDRMESVIPTQSRLVFIADGARWIWNWVESLYPESTQILDFYHAFEHAAAFAALQFRQQNQRKDWLEQARQWLNNDQLDLLLEELRQLKPTNHAANKARDKLLNYYWNNYHRMQYQSFRDQGLLIGSGPIEAAHRTVIQKRLKLSGQRWNTDNAQKILNLRVAKEANHWDYVIDAIRSAA